MKGFVTAALLAAVIASPAALHAQDEIEVPLRISDGRFIVTAVTAEGVEMDFALSTGNSTTVLSEMGAAIIENHGDPTMNGVAISMDDPAIIPDDRLSDDGSVMGMIGANTLNEFDVLIDAPGGRLVLKRPGPPVSWDGMALSDPTPLRIYHGVVLSLDVALNGQTFGAMLDIGTQSVVVNSPAHDKIGLAGAETVGLGVGSVTISDLPVTLEEESPILSRFDPNGAGFAIVGAPMAYDCALSISWIRREVRTCVR